MKLTWIKAFSLQKLKATFIRFPLSILSSATAAVCFWLLTSYEVDVNQDFMGQCFAASFNGILLFTGLALFAEGKGLRSITLQLLGIPALYLFFFQLTSAATIGYSSFALAAGLVFLSSLGLIFGGAFAFSSDDRGLWQFIMRTFIQAVIALAVGVALGIGLSLALISIETLFSIYGIGNAEMQAIWSFSMIFVASMVFLSWLTREFKILGKEEVFESRGIKLVAHFFSFPMLGLYGLILLAYLGKIAWLRDWPEGLVALPVLVFSLLGFFTYGLLSVFKDDKKEKSIQFFLRFFPWTVLPLMAVYFLAFWQRIAQYGITENRYLGVALGLLLTGWAAYYAFVRNARLKVFPLSIFVFALLIAFGPWGVSQISERSQVARLEKILTENSLLIDDKLQAQKSEDIPGEVQAEVFSVLEYLSWNHRYASIEAWFPETVLNLGYAPSAYDLMDAMGLKNYQYGYGRDVLGDVSYFYSTTYDPFVAVEGFDYLVNDVNVYSYSGDSPITSPSHPDLTLRLDEKGQLLLLDFSGENLEIPLKDFIEKVQTTTNPNDVEKELMTLEIQGGKFKAHFALENLTLIGTGADAKVDSLYGKLLINLN